MEPALASDNDDSSSTKRVRNICETDVGKILLAELVRVKFMPHFSFTSFNPVKRCNKNHAFTKIESGESILNLNLSRVSSLLLLLTK